MPMPARAATELAAMPIAHMIRRLSDAFIFSLVSAIFAISLASDAARSAFVAICSRAPVSVAMRIFSHAMKFVAPKRALWRLVALAGDAPSG